MLGREGDIIEINAEIINYINFHIIEMYYRFTLGEICLTVFLKVWPIDPVHSAQLFSMVRDFIALPH